MAVTFDDILAGIDRDPLDINEQENNNYSWLRRNIFEPFGVGAGQMMNDTVIGGGGLVLSALGTGYDWAFGEDVEGKRQTARDYGIPDDIIQKYLPEPEDNFLTSAAKSVFDVRNDIKNYLDEDYKKVVGDDPSFFQEAVKGSGSSMGFLLSGLAMSALGGANPVARALLGAITAGGLEAVSETAGFLGDAHAQGKFNEALPIAGKDFLTNAALNIGLDYGLGAFNPKITGINNPLKRWTARTIAETANELLQEPSQHIIENASNMTLNNGAGFLSNLGESAKDFPDTFLNLAPETAASTLITSLLTGGLGAVDMKLGKNQYERNLENQIQQSNEAQARRNFLSSQVFNPANYQEMDINPDYQSDYQNAYNEIENLDNFLDSVKNSREKLEAVRNTPFWNMYKFYEQDAQEAEARRKQQEALQREQELLQTQGYQSDLQQKLQEQQQNLQQTPQNQPEQQTLQPVQQILQEQEQTDDRPEIDKNPFYTVNHSILSNGVRDIHTFTENDPRFDERKFSKSDLQRLQEVSKVFKNSSRDEQLNALKIIPSNNIRRIAERFFGIESREGKTMKKTTRIEAIMNAWDYAKPILDAEIRKEQELQYQKDAQQIETLKATNLDNKQNFEDEGRNQRAEQIKAERPNAGRISKVTTANGSTVETQFRVLDINDLIPSNTDTGAVNPEFPQELQPRQRTRKSSLDQINKIANNLNPELLGDNILAGNGAPIVGSDLVVESGNGRVLGIRSAYHIGKGDNYKNWLTEHASDFGLQQNDITSIKFPVLVRERLTDVDRVKFTQEAEKITKELKTESGRSLDKANPNEFLLTLNGSKTLGFISEQDAQKASKAGVKPIEIRARVSVIEHIRKSNHEESIKNAGYYDIASFISDVLDTYEEVYEGTNDSLILAKRNNEKHHAVAAVKIEQSSPGFYTTKTGWIIRDRSLNKKNLLFVRSEPITTSSGSDETLRINSSQPEESTPNALLKSSSEILNDNQNKNNAVSEIKSANHDTLQAQSPDQQPNKNKSQFIRHENVTDYDSLISRNKEAEPEFHTRMKELQKELGGELKERTEMKREARIKEKVKSDYDGDFSRVVDVWGGSLIFDNEQDLLKAAEKLKQRVDVVRFKDRWTKPDKSGYRDMNANIRLNNGTVVELQLHNKGIMDVKNEIGHLLYEFIRRNENSSDHLMESNVDKANKISNLIYNAGINGTYQDIDANSRASLLDISRRLSNQTSAREAEALVNDLSALTRKTFLPSSSETIDPDSRNSTANGTSSPFSKYLNTTDNTSLNENIGNVTQNKPAVKRDIKQEITDKILKLNHKAYDQQAAEHASEIMTAGLKTFARYTGKNLEQVYDALNFDVRKSNNDKVRGYSILSQAENIINLTQNADKSTFVHENAHMFLNMYKNLARSENANTNQDFMQDWNAVSKWLRIENVDLNSDLSKNKEWRNAQEKFASGFEKYIMTGKAPTSKLARVFEAFKDWLKNVYKHYNNIKFTDYHGEKKKVLLTPEIKEFYGHLLSRGELAEIQEQTQNTDNSEIYNQPNLDPDAPKSKGVTDYKSLIDKNQKRNKAFITFVDNLQKKFGGQIKINNGLGNEKEIKNAAEKYYDGDYSRVTDVLSGTLIFDKYSDLQNAIEKLSGSMDYKDTIKAVRNNFKNGDENGYRNYVASIILPHGTVAELNLKYAGVENLHDTFGKRIERFISRNSKNQNMQPVIEKVQNASKKLYHSVMNGSFNELDNASMEQIENTAKELGKTKDLNTAQALAMNLDLLTNYDLARAKNAHSYKPYFDENATPEENLQKSKRSEYLEMAKKHASINSIEVKNNDDYSFSNPETEERYSKAKLGEIPKNVFVKIMHGAKDVLKNFSDPYPKLTVDKNLQKAKSLLQQLGNAKSAAVNRAMYGITKNLKDLDVQQLNLFGRMRLLNDLVWRVNDKPDAELPFAFDKKSLLQEHARFSKLVDGDQKVKNAIAAEENSMAELTKEFISTAKELNLDLSNVFRNPHYYRHSVLMFADHDNKSKHGNLKYKNYDVFESELSSIQNRSYMKKYKGSQLDINANYVEANGSVRSQMMADLETMKTLIEIKKLYDKAPELRKMLNKSRQDNIKNDKEIYNQAENQTILDLIPEGYSIFDTGASGLIQSANTTVENIIATGFDQISESSGIDFGSLLEAAGQTERLNQAMILPQALTETLKDVAKTSRRGKFGDLAKNITTMWKKWALFSPLRFIKYELRNMTGDTDALMAGRLSAFKYTKRALTELKNYMYGDPEKASEALKTYATLAGGIEMKLAQVEEANVTSNEARAYNSLKDKIIGTTANGLSKLKKSTWDKYFEVVTKAGSYREHLLRYAAYLDFLDELNNNDGKPKAFTASNPDEVMALSTNEERAYRLANDLLGNYDNISQSGRWLRDCLIPFYSWYEANAKRYYWLVRNGLKGENASGFVKNLALAKATKLPFYTITAGTTFAKIAAFTMLVQMFNRLVFPDDDDKLTPDIKYRPHLTLGSIGNEVIYFDRIGSLQDLADWIGLDSAVEDVKKLKRNEMTMTDYILKMPKSFISKFVGSLNPMLKVPTEMLTGRTLYPDALNPRTIKEMDDYIAGTIGLTREWRALNNKPGDKYFSLERLSNLFVYKTDVEENSYFHILDRVRQFQESVLDKKFDGFATTARGRALRNLKASIRYHDKANIKRYTQEYIKAGGDTKKLGQSMKRMHPLGSLTKDEQAKFLKWLSKEDRVYLQRAIRYYNKNFSSYTQK